MKESTTQLMLFIGAVLVLALLITLISGTDLSDFVKHHIDSGIPKY